MISLALKRCPPLICFQRNLMPFLLDYKSALIKREWISCDDISWFTQILMERIKWVWLIDSQAAKQSHHQSLLTHLLTRSLTRSIHQSINESMDGSRDTLHPLNITFVTARKLTGGFVCVLSEIQCYLLIYIPYCCKLPTYICLIRHFWPKKISGIYIIHKISTHFSFRAEI